jgi:hypothetical protein
MHQQSNGNQYVANEKVVDTRNLFDTKATNELYPWSLLIEVGGTEELKKLKGIQPPKSHIVLGIHHYKPENPVMPVVPITLLEPESQRPKKMSGKPEDVPPPAVELEVSHSVPEMPSSIVEVSPSSEEPASVVMVPDTTPDEQNCLISGNIFPIKFSECCFNGAIIPCEIWETIGKPKLEKTSKLGIKFKGKQTSFLGKTKVSVEVKGKNGFIPVLVLNNTHNTATSENNKLFVYIGRKGLPITDFPFESLFLSEKSEKGMGWMKKMDWMRSNF